MRISDWSSDVCSSDLFKATQPNLFAPIFNILPNGSPITSEVANLHLIEPEILFRAERDLPPREEAYSYEEVASAVVAVPAFEFLATRFSAAFTTLLDRKSVVWGKSVSVRVDFGGRR